MKPEYNIEYFIEKFSAIPEDRWAMGTVLSENRSCALGHCGVRVAESGTAYTSTEEADALVKIFGGADKLNFGIVWRVNDNCVDIRWGDTPKERILNKLLSLSLQHPIEEEYDKDAEEAVKQVKEFIETIPFEEVSNV